MGQKRAVKMRGDLSLAAAAVRQRLAELSWNMRDLSRQASVDYGTVRSLLNEQAKPQIATRAAIERALGWPPGAIEQAALGRDIRVDTVPDVLQAEAVLFASYDAESSTDKLRVLQDISRRILEELQSETDA